jgi:hypothetical protein
MTVLIALMLLLNGGDGSAATGGSGGSGSTDLNLEVVSLVWRGQPALRLTVLNQSHKSFWFNKRMLWNSPFQDREIREVDIEVRDGSGNVRPFECKKRAFPAGRADYMALHPGDLVGRVIPLDCVQLPKGHYRAVVKYLDSNHPEGLGTGFPRFDKELVSTPVEFSVE